MLTFEDSLYQGKSTCVTQTSLTVPNCLDIFLRNAISLLDDVISIRSIPFIKGNMGKGGKIARQLKFRDLIGQAGKYR